MAVRTVSGQQGRVRTGRVGAQGAGSVTPPSSNALLINATDHLLLAGGTNVLLLS